MNYPQQGYGQPPQGGWQPQGYQQQGMQQGYQQGPPQNGYAPGPGDASAGYDFGSLYGMADHSTITPLEPGNYDAVVEEATFGKTKDGTKGAWTIKFRVTTGERANFPLTMTMAINPVKTNGEPNDKGLGIMFRQLAAMGVPVPPNQPFWTLGWSEHNVAECMVRKPVLIRVVNDEWDGGVRSKVADIKPPRPGAPAEVQKNQAPQQAALPPQGGGYGPPQQTYQGGPGYQPDQSYNGAYGVGGGGGGGGYPPQQPQQTAPGPWQNAQPQTAGPQQGQGAPWGQQGGVPGQGGQGGPGGQGQPYTDPFGGQPLNYGQANGTAEGAPTPGAPAPAPQGNGYTQSPGPQQQWNQAPPAQFQPPQGQPPQQQPGQPPQGAPELPPWAQ